ncbi:MAG: DUF1800 domain-containing protein [Acidimicrobiales bacterium]|nr:DUF1800 domain-containing protein [Acidimicrobiales bacterium]
MTNSSTTDRSPTTEATPAATPTPAVTTRRALLQAPWQRIAMIAAGAAGASAVLAACDVVDAPFDRSTHLARRATFGATPDTIAAIAADEAGWLQAQLNPSTLDTTALDAKLASLPALSLTPTELMTTYPDNATSFEAGLQLPVAWLIRAVESPAQLFERMVEFWNDHFNVPTEARFSRLMKIAEDRLVMRTHALGRFKDLLAGSASSPAMLDYLDNRFSIAGNPNENYARELLELHTMGVDGGYTEADIVNTARLLTGWSVIGPLGLFFFRVNQHDTSPLSIMGWNRPTDTDYLQHGFDFLDWLAMRPETATFVCRKIARRFVSDMPSQAIVDAMAATWLANDSQIAPVLQTMFAHPDFDAAAGTKFNRPLDYMFARLRAVQADVQPITDITILQPLAQLLGGLGQIPFQWPAPNGYPDVEGAWRNTGGLLNRWNLVGDLLANNYPVISFDPTYLTAPLTGLTAPEIFDSLAMTLLQQPTTAAGRGLLLTQTAWSETTVPSQLELTEKLPLIVFILKASPDAMYR